MSAAGLRAREHTNLHLFALLSVGFARFGTEPVPVGPVLGTPSLLHPGMKDFFFACHGQELAVAVKANKPTVTTFSREENTIWLDLASVHAIACAFTAFSPDVSWDPKRMMYLDHVGASRGLQEIFKGKSSLA